MIYQFFAKIFLKIFNPNFQSLQLQIRNLTLILNFRKGKWDILNIFFNGREIGLLSFVRELKKNIIIHMKSLELGNMCQIQVMVFVPREHLLKGKASQPKIKHQITKKHVNHFCKSDILTGKIDFFWNYKMSLGIYWIKTIISIP